MVFFKSLQDYNDVKTHEFTESLKDDMTIVKGLAVEVIENMVAEVLGLPAVGKRLFYEKGDTINF